MLVSWVFPAALTELKLDHSEYPLPSETLKGNAGRLYGRIPYTGLGSRAV